MSDLLPGAEPFFFHGGPVGALLIHGFTSAPREMRPLGEALAAAGCTVLGPRLAHHGTRLEDLYRTHWRDWYTAALDGYYLLRDQCETVFVMGLSMGGTLALYLAAHYPVAGVVSLSAPSVPLLRRLGWRVRAAGPLSFLVRQVGKRPRSGEGDPNHLAYPRYSVRAAAQLFTLLRLTAEALPAVRAPALLVHSRDDRGVLPDNLPYIYERLGSPAKEQFWLDNGGHVVTEGAESQRLFARVLEFVRAHASLPAAEPAPYAAPAQQP